MAFTDMLGQYVDNRIQGATDRLSQGYGLLTGDENAWNQQFGLNETEEERKKRLRREAQARGEVLPDDVVETTQVKTYGDGSQTETVRREIPAPAEVQAQIAAQPPLDQPTVEVPPTPAPTPAPQLSMAQQAYEDEMARMGQMPQPVAPEPQPMAAPQPQQAAPAAVAPVAPAPAPAPAPQPQMAIPAVPTPLPAAGPGINAPVAAAPVPAVPAVPAPGPEVQVAGPAQMPPAAAPAPVAAAPAPVAAAPAPVAEPAWIKEANDAGTDLDKLLAVASKYPEARGELKEKMRASIERGRAEEDAMKLISAANNGDLKALNKIQQALRPDTGKQKEEVTTSDYIKAYMYARLGLNKLAEEAQNKIIGKDTKFGQVTVDGSNWQVETNAQGNIIRAKDDEGNVATEATLNKLRAGSMKLGTQAFGFTGGSVTIPAGQKDAGQEYRQRTNNITGAIENIITTGPNAGKIYSGPPGLEKRVETSTQIAYNNAQVKFNTEPSIAGATELMKLAVANDTGDGREIRNAQATISQRLGPAALSQIVPSMQPAPGTAAPAAVQPGAVPAAPGAQAAPAPAAPAAPAATTTYQSSPRRANESPTMYTQRLAKEKAAFDADIEKKKQLELAKEKPPEEAKGKIAAKDINNQNFANETYGLIRPVADLIKQSTGSGVGAKVDSLAALIGSSPKGAQAIAQLEPMVYPILANVPRFEGPQSDYDVKTYMRAAGDFANAEKPVATRLAALQGMITLLKKYDKEGKNDWTFGESQQPATSGTTSSGNKYKRVQ